MTVVRLSGFPSPKLEDLRAKFEYFSRQTFGGVSVIKRADQEVCGVQTLHTPRGNVNIKGKLWLKITILGNFHGEGYFASLTFLKKMQNGVKHLAKISKKLEEILFQNTLSGPYLAQYCSDDPSSLVKWTPTVILHLNSTSCRKSIFCIPLGNESLVLLPPLIIQIKFNSGVYGVRFCFCHTGFHFPIKSCPTRTFSEKCSGIHSSYKLLKSRYYSQ